MNNNAPVIWLTGMSASGKTTIACRLKNSIEQQGFTVSIIDGDTVRGSDDEKLGFGFSMLRYGSFSSKSKHQKNLDSLGKVVAAAQ